METIQQIIATIFVLSHNIHWYHVNMKWTWFVYYHPFLGEIYSYLIWQIDDLREYLKQNGQEIIVDTEKLYSISKVEAEISQVSDILQIKEKVSESLWNLQAQVEQGINSEMWDVTTQQKLIDVKLALKKFIWFNDSERGV